jgi:hypothetical protein
MGTERDDLAQGLHMYPVGDYLLLYRRVRGGIQLARVVHGARDLRRLFRKRKGLPRRAPARYTNPPALRMTHSAVSRPTNRIRNTQWVTRVARSLGLLNRPTCSRFSVV